MTLSKGEFPKSRMRVLLNGFAGKNIGMNTGVGIWNNSRLLRRNIAIGGEVFTAGLGTQGHSSIQLNFGKNTCWKFTAQVGIDDEIHVLGGVKKAFGEFAISSFADDRWKEVYSTTKDLAKEKRGPLKALQQAYPITVTNLSSVSSIRLIARRPNPLPLRFPQVNEHYDWAWAKLYCGPDAPYLPIPKIISPVGRAEYKIGDNVTCNGRATYYDGKTAITDPAMFSWNVLLMHCEGELCHTHWQTRGQGKSISFTVVDHGSLNQYYYFECELTVTDKCGRSDTVAKSIRIAGRTVMY